MTSSIAVEVGERDVPVSKLFPEATVRQDKLRVALVARPFPDPHGSGAEAPEAFGGRGNQERVRVDVDSPKSVRSVRFAALSDGLLASIDEWRSVSFDPRGHAWVFPSEKLTTPMARDNCWRRGFPPKLKPLGLAWANFQVMRRTHSCLLKELDVDPQVRAEQMGHTVDVNENVYTTTSLKRRRKVNALERAIGA